MNRKYIANLIVVLFAFLAVHVSAAGKSAAPQFATTPIQLTEVVGVAIKLDLHTLLVDPTVTGIVWSIVNGPNWLSVDPNTGLLSGTPPPSALGTASFGLSAIAGELGDTNHPTVMTIVAPPSWTVTPINLGNQPDTVAISYQLSTDVSNPSGGTLT